MRQLQRFQDQIRELEAVERLELATVSDFPHLKAEWRRSLHERWLAEAGAAISHDETPGPRVSWSHVRSFVGAQTP